MTNYHAIATVTATLRNLLYYSLNVPPFGGVTITAKPPDVLEHHDPGSALNLFLYHVVRNSGYENLDIPTHNTSGELVKTPVLALNLYYLLTAYTSKSHELEDIQRQQILAKAMIALNEKPILTRKDIHQARITNDDIPDTDTGDHLDNQVELVKISFQPQSLEEMSKLWSTFFQTHYRLSVSYVATAVLLDSVKEIKAGLPVQERKLYVLPLRRPVIERVEQQIIERTSDAKITLMGQNLLASSVKILFGTTTSVIPKPGDMSETQITVQIPTELTAGIKTVQVAHPLMVGEPAVEHENWDVSNTVAFVLAPQITSKSPTAPISRGDKITLTVEPGVTSDQRVVVFVGNHSYDLKIPSSPVAIKTLPAIVIPLTFPVKGTKESFLLRVRIDGADSFVRLDETSKMYVPFVEITK